MGPDVLVDLTPLDTFSRFSGTGRYVRELAMALAGLSPHERKGFTLSALTRLSGGRSVGSLEWPGSPNVRWEEPGELAWLMARRTRLPLTLRRIRPRLFHATYSLGTPRGSRI